ncbi:MAG: 6-phosphofructokinase [Flavobacteriales bacterium]|nr:6-phosphofructokinase [Flavobacteriales bacterium]
MKKVAIFTSGGDAPGMNACIRALVRTGIYHNVKVMGIMNGYDGMINGQIVELDSAQVGNIIQRGGTILKSSRSEEFRTYEGRKKAFEVLKKNEIEGIVCIGGNGTYTGAGIFYEEFGIPSIGVPGTIDNDLYGTDQTIGYDTALNTAMEAIDKIRDTADSHNRVFLVEVMGRDSGFIGLAVGIAGGAESILIPEDHKDLERLYSLFSKKDGRQKAFSIIVVAEGEEGGVLKVASQLKERFPQLDIRSTILGHIQRGGSPSARDRILATRLGVSALERLIEGGKNECVGLINNNIHFTSFKEAISKRKPLPKYILGMTDKLSV